jgi:hypothetical protein
MHAQIYHPKETESHYTCYCLCSPIHPYIVKYVYIYIAVNRESIFPFWIKRMEVRKRSDTFAIPYIYYIYIHIYILYTYIYIYYVYAYRLHLNVEIDQQKKHRHMYTPTYAI